MYLYVETEQFIAMSTKEGDMKFQTMWYSTCLDSNQHAQPLFWE